MAVIFRKPKRIKEFDVIQQPEPTNTLASRFGTDRTELTVKTWLDWSDWLKAMAVRKTTVLGWLHENRIRTPADGRTTAMG